MIFVILIVLVAAIRLWVLSCSSAKAPLVLKPPLNIASAWKRPDNSRHDAPWFYPWCHLTPQDPIPHGLIYIKIDKASSSTLTGINLRLAHRIGTRMAAAMGKDTTAIATTCAHTYQHFHAWPRLSKGHDPFHSSSVLWTFLRDPYNRAMAEYFHFLVSRRGYGVTYTLLHSFLESTKNFQTKYAMVPSASSLQYDSSFTNTNLTKILLDVVENRPSSTMGFLDLFVMKRYDFIGLVERMDESLAVMKLLWNLTIADLIVLSAKQSGSYDDGRYQNRCVRITKPNEYFSRGPKEKKLFNRIQDYVQKGFRHNNLDYPLYSEINARLDVTIQMLGRDKVERTIQDIRYLRRKAETECRNEAVFPCSSNGTNQWELSAKNCYWYDSGCGYQCVDRVVDQMAA